MKREVGFYGMVFGLTTYFFLLGLFIYLPVLSALSGRLTTETVVVFIFLGLVLYPISMLSIHTGNTFLQYVNMRYVIPLGVVPFLVISVGLWLIV